MNRPPVSLPVHPALPKHASEAMLARAKAGDLHAREAFIQANTLLAAKVVHRFPGLEPEEAYAIALTAMARALDPFDTSDTRPWAPYATVAMKNALLKEITKSETASRGHGDIPRSLDEPIGFSESGEPIHLHDTLAAPDPDMDAVEWRDAARTALSYLQGRELEVVERHYGLNGFMAQTLAEIAEHLGLSRQRVYDLHATALNHMAGVGGKHLPEYG